jgi:hypothetical protein
MLGTTVGDAVMVAEADVAVCVLVLVCGASVLEGMALIAFEKQASSVAPSTIKTPMPQLLPPDSESETEPHRFGHDEICPRLFVAR